MSKPRRILAMSSSMRYVREIRFDPMKLLMCCCWRAAQCWLRFSRTGAIVVGVCLGGESICSDGFAQETLEELLEVAGPHWEKQRKQNYEQLAIRIEEFEDHRSEASNQIRRTRDSRDYFAEGADKLIRRSRSTTLSQIEPDESPLDSETSTWNVVTAQNSHYGFRVQRPTAEEPWNIKQQVVWDVEPTWRWLMDPLPNGSPLDEILMRELSLDPRLGVGSSDNPLDLICGQIRKIAAEQHGIGEQHGGEIVQRVDANGKRVAAITFHFNRELNSARLPESEKDAVRYLTNIKIELLPDQDWQLLYYETRNDLLNDSEQTIRTYRWTTQVDYAPGDSKWLYQITDTEDATRGVIKTNRFIRLLTDDEKAELRPLCRLSGFGLPELD